MGIQVLTQAIQKGSVAEHPAWEDTIVWKNQEIHTARLRQLVENEER